MIHKTAIVDPKAKISSNVAIGAFSVVGPDVEIDENTIIHSHVVVSGNTKIGKNNKICLEDSIMKLLEEGSFKPKIKTALNQLINMIHKWRKESLNMKHYDLSLIHI